jgi:hypothetical protein
MSVVEKEGLYLLRFVMHFFEIPFFFKLTEIVKKMIPPKKNF